MRVGTRITAAASLVVAFALTLFAFVHLRSARTERADALHLRAQSVGLVTRAVLERQEAESLTTAGKAIAKELSRVHAPWTFRVLSPRELQTQALNPRDRPLLLLLHGQLSHSAIWDKEKLRYAVPIRARAKQDALGTHVDVVGVLELTIPTTPLQQAARQDAVNTLLPLAIVVVMVIAAVMFLLRTLVSMPIKKLLSGIDDVARGDLSRVLLAEREDEIGALATRFNEMTYSLRESQAETARQNQARGHLEQRLFQTEKLATIGQISAEIAHEVGTPLNVIAGRARSLGKKSTEPELVEKNANIIAEQATRITRIIQRLLGFSRRKIGHQDQESVDLNAVTLTTMEFLESKLNAQHIQHSLQQSQRLPHVSGSGDQLQQVVLNVVLNASDAMPEGGTLSVETRLETKKRPGLELAAEQAVVVVEVRDTGTGIAESQRSKVFEPFYTTKADKGGTGLGLAVVHGIVKDHDGWIEIAENPGGGALVRIHLPPSG